MPPGCGRVVITQRSIGLTTSSDGRADRDAVADERLLDVDAVGLDEHVAAEAAAVPRADRAGAEDRHARLAGVVERAVGPVPLEPRRPGLVLEVGGDLEAPGDAAAGAAQLDVPPQPRRQRGVVGGDRAVGQRDLDVGGIADEAGRGEQQLAAPAGPSGPGRCRGRRAPTAGRRRCRARRSSAVSSSSPCIDLTG